MFGSEKGRVAAEGATPHKTAEVVSQQSFNLTFLDTLASDFSPSQAPAATPLPGESSKQDQPRQSFRTSKDAQELAQISDAAISVSDYSANKGQTTSEDVQQADGAKDADENHLLEETSASDSSSSIAPQAESKPHPGVPTLLLSTVQKGMDSGSHVEEAQPNGETHIDDSHPSQSEMSVPSHRISPATSESLLEAETRLSDAKVEISIRQSPSKPPAKGETSVLSPGTESQVIVGKKKSTFFGSPGKPKL